MSDWETCFDYDEISKKFKIKEEFKDELEKLDFEDFMGNCVLVLQNYLIEAIGRAREKSEDAFYYGPQEISTIYDKIDIDFLYEVYLGIVHPTGERETSYTQKRNKINKWIREHGDPRFSEYSIPVFKDKLSEEITQILNLYEKIPLDPKLNFIKSLHHLRPHQRLAFIKGLETDSPISYLDYDIIPKIFSKVGQPSEDSQTDESRGGGKRKTKRRKTKRRKKKRKKSKRKKTRRRRR